MRFEITLVVLVTGGLFVNKLQAQDQRNNLPAEKKERYDTFSAIYDEVGSKADVHQGYDIVNTAPPKKEHDIETWVVTEAWKALSGQEQSAYLERLDTPNGFMLINGLEIICWGVNIADKTQLSNIDFFTIWSVPNEEGFDQVITDTDWYTYFREINVSDKDVISQEVLGYLFRQ